MKATDHIQNMITAYRRAIVHGATHEAALAAAQVYNLNASARQTRRWLAAIRDAFTPETYRD